jgi:metal-responsive CopG/Arc/MetJ family transcriptional regulator
MESDVLSVGLVPSGMLPQIDAAAAEERRAPAELVREALERYLEDRAWKKLFVYGESRAQALGFAEEDVPRLIAETRSDHRQDGA